ncbi:protein E33A [Elephant endotheliotropic herpesvirus 2]|nr:protein E33A [Elephant endotheliotropic herpesvirus 2]
MVGIKYQKIEPWKEIKSMNRSVDRSCMRTWLVILVAYLVTITLIDVCWTIYCIFAFGLFGPDPQFTHKDEYWSYENIICNVN